MQHSSSLHIGDCVHEFWCETLHGFLKPCCNQCGGTGVQCLFSSANFSCTYNSVMCRKPLLIALHQQYHAACVAVNVTMQFGFGLMPCAINWHHMVCCGWRVTIRGLRSLCCHVTCTEQSGMTCLWQHPDLWSYTLLALCCHQPPSSWCTSTLT
jgi:hypothetical protein